MIRVLHLSDIHYKEHYANINSKYGQIFNELTTPIELFDFSINQIMQNEQQIDAIFITGDLTENGTTHDYTILKDHILRKVGNIPIFVTLGNHDSKICFRNGWLGVNASNEPYNYSIKFKDVQIISLDNSIQGNYRGEISQDQCNWLRRELVKIDDRPTLLLTHHHLLKEQRTMEPANIHKDFYEIVEQYNITAIFCGHVHLHYTGSFANKQYYCADSMSFLGTELKDNKIRFEERFGYSVYDISKGKVVVHTIKAFNTDKVLGLL